ncbi:sigma-70 family RNA polymerase sigma factor [Roseiconus nitratireducens]|uniref:Sigma-70 family RNA polymerase sigma factor n=1 Tax=Roseiconus nitratireducens TaxID=2605748 RepID=A0A5M6CU92_9BACT|nr:sigma-70 family RNA polymerase sigma factor [Roseiconus nitratireducens]KAA5538814.1 sigma-70 family RNA polymerase sigma factor [Roseiconus nitratireducens]
MTEISDSSASSKPIDASDPAIIAQYEPYLRMLARTRMRRAYQAKIGASDMVQQAMLQAVQGFDGFRGNTEAELLAWLRQILAHHLCHLDRDLHRDKRDIRREQSMEQKLAASSMRLEGLLAGDGPTPSQNVAFGENIVRISQAIAELPEPQADAVRLHYLEGMKLKEVADELGKSTGAVAGLLHRGMKALRKSLDG